MKQRIFLTFLLSFFCISSQLLCQEEPDPNETPEEQAEDQEEFDTEFFDNQDINTEIDEEFDEYEEEDGVITEEIGPIGTDYYVDIADGTIETWSDKFEREDSYFVGLDDHLTDDKDDDKDNEEDLLGLDDRQSNDEDNPKENEETL